ncbi:MAG: phosphate ABC transporter ATP-binding protein, partial [Gemmatimonadaceae bacterium]
MPLPLHGARPRAVATTDDVRVTAPSRPRLAVEALNAYFGSAHAVRDVSLAVADHEVTAVIGPSGCGK